MHLLLKYRMPIILLFFSSIGFALSSMVKSSELKWYYIAGTPFIALVIGLLTNFISDAEWNKKLKREAASVSLVLCALFILSFSLHLLAFVNGTFRYKDVHDIKRTYIKGYNYTDTALQYKKKYSINSDAELLYEWFGGIEGINDVWTPSAIHSTTIHLIISYCGTILFLSALISWILGVAYEKRFLYPQRVIQEIMEEKEISNYEKYLLTFREKQNNEQYKQLKFHVFLSYASSDIKLAEAIYYSLINSGHITFFDRSTLPAGLEYNAAIHTAIIHSDIFIFMISPASVAEGHYTLSELKFASEHWPAANGVLLPVLCTTTPFEQIPAYVQSVTILIPKGNVVAEVTAEVERLYNKKHLLPK